MSDAAQTGSEPEESPLSPWWIRSVMIVMVVGLAGLITITLLAYRNAPPIPARIVDASGTSLFTGDDISNGQAVFLRYGLMNNGTIWGHGAYLGPDYSAEALHHIGENTAAALAQRQYGQPLAALTPTRASSMRLSTLVTSPPRAQPDRTPAPPRRPPPVGRAASDNTACLAVLRAPPALPRRRRAWPVRRA